MRKTSSTQNYRTGPGFTKPVKGLKEPSSSQTEIQYVYVDKLTGNQSDGYKNLDAVKTAIKRVENVKGYGRSQYWYFGK
mgnify:CR=1 FL=1